MIISFILPQCNLQLKESKNLVCIQQLLITDLIQGHFEKTRHIVSHEPFDCCGRAPSSSAKH